METKNIGLRGIEVADTRISNIDGEKGKLIYRGFDILDLTKNSTFEETSYLLLYDKLPTKHELDEYNAKLIEARYIPKQMQKNMGNWRKDAATRLVLLPPELRHVRENAGVSCAEQTRSRGKSEHEKNHAAAAGSARDAQRY